MTNPVNVVDVLPMLVTKLQSLHYINGGGCGVVAAHISKRLQRVVPTRVVIYNRDKSINIDNIRSRLTNTMSPFEWDSNGMRWDHVMVEFDYNGNTYLFDSTGIFPASDTIYAGNQQLTKSGYITIDEMVSIASRPYSWNWMFDRSQIPVMKQRIQRFFKKHIFVEV